jgi:hypothetical protein
LPCADGQPGVWSDCRAGPFLIVALQSKDEASALWRPARAWILIDRRDRSSFDHQYLLASENFVRRRSARIGALTPVSGANHTPPRSPIAWRGTKKGTGFKIWFSWISSRVESRKQRQLAVLPPFTRMIWPVMNVALSEATKTMASAISSGVPPRFRGTAA